MFYLFYKFNQYISFNDIKYYICIIMIFNPWGEINNLRNIIDSNDKISVYGVFSNKRPLTQHEIKLNIQKREYLGITGKKLLISQYLFYYSKCGRVYLSVFENFMGEVNIDFHC